MSQNTKILSAQGISVGYDAHPPILDGVSFDIYERDFIGVIGPNGGGKTTLMKAILGLIPLQKGRISYYSPDGKETSSLPVGYVPQQNAIDRKFPISVEEVVAYGLLSPTCLRPKGEKKARVLRALEMMQMADQRKRPIGTLSGGQLQRVLIARAIVSQPRLLILDEPNTYVDSHFESQLYALLPTLNQETAIVIVSHDIGSISNMVGRLFCIHRDLHIHENIQSFCSECSEASSLKYISLLEHASCSQKRAEEIPHPTPFTLKK